MVKNEVRIDGTYGYGVSVSVYSTSLGKNDQHLRTIAIYAGPASLQTYATERELRALAAAFTAAADSLVLVVQPEAEAA